MSNNRDKIVVYYDEKRRVIAKIVGREHTIVGEYSNGEYSQVQNRQLECWHHVATVEEKLAYYRGQSLFLDKQCDDLSKGVIAYDKLKVALEDKIKILTEWKNDYAEKFLEMQHHINQYKELFLSYRQLHLFGYEILIRKNKDND